MKVTQFAVNELVFYHPIVTGDTIGLEITQVTANIPKTVNPVVQVITDNWFKCQFTTVTGQTQENLTGGTIYLSYDGYFDYKLKKNGTTIEESQFFMVSPINSVVEVSGSTGYVVTNPYAGSSGSSGLSGTNGISGTHGSSGSSGLTGSSGSSGTAGSSASAGSSGVNGTSGSSASSGSSGTSGQNGSSGSSATAGTSGSSASSGSSATAGSSGLTGADGDGTAYYGQVSKITSGTINIASAGVYQSTGLVGTLDSEAYGVALGTTDTFAVKNTTGSAQLFKIYGSADIDTGNNKTLGIKLALNGTPINNTECNAPTGNGTSFAKLITNWMIELQPNDEVALYVTNKSNSGNVTLLRARLVASTVGKQGSNGTSGSAGTAGSSGISGTSGTSGLTGSSGSSGTAGSTGSSGSSGITGSSGTSYAAGFVQTRAGQYSFTYSAGSPNRTITFGVPMPSTNYAVTFESYENSNNDFITMVSKSTTDFTFSYDSPSSATIEWMAIEYNTGTGGIAYGTSGTSGSSGSSGSSGATGTAGAGVPTGGTAGQVLAKVDGTNYNTQWVNQSGGGGGTGMTFNQFWSQIVDDLNPHPADPTALEPYSIKISYNAGLASVVNIVDTGNNILKTVYTGTTYTPTLNASTIAFLDATGIAEESVTALALDDLVVGLKTNSLWDKILTLYPMVGGTATTHKYNLKDPRDLNAAYRLSFSGGWTHNSSGAKPNGSNAYADTYFNPVANSLTTANAHLAYYAGTYASTSDSCEIGNYTNDGIGFVMQCKSSIGNKLRCFFTYSYPAGYASIPRGFVAFSATANTRRDAYVAGTSVGNNTTTDNGTLGNYSLYIGAAHINGASANSYSDALCSLASIGNGLTSGEISTYNTLVATFETALSRNV
jgi:hypothetical protein